MTVKVAGFCAGVAVTVVVVGAVVAVAVPGLVVIVVVIVVVVGVVVIVAAPGVVVAVAVAGGMVAVAVVGDADVTVTRGAGVAVTGVIGAGLAVFVSAAGFGQPDILQPRSFMQSQKSRNEAPFLSFSLA